MKGLTVMMLAAFLAGVSLAYDERPIVPADAAVQVRFQLKSPNGRSWSTATAVLKGSVSESMMVNELSRRYPNRDIRILAADCGKDISTQVRYQISRDGKSWTGGTAVLTNALTESMMRNQLMQRFPNTQVRILSVAGK
jgi:hypothetical protein